jgi:hypothetical protein
MLPVVEPIALRFGNMSFKKTFYKFLNSLGFTLAFCGLLGWLYGVLIQITHPEWLSEPLSHLTPWIRVDTFAILSFMFMVIGCFLWRYFEK